MRYKFSEVLIHVFILLSLSGCAMTWTPHLEEAGIDNPTEQSEQLAVSARILFEQSKDRASLLQSIEAHQKVLTENPGDYAALVALSTQHILLGTAYTEERGEKTENFRQAMRYAERGMYTNADFKNSVAGGTSPWDASDTLGKEEVEAMFFWVTALQYEFKEGMTLAGKIVNVRWMQHALKFLDRIEQVAPDFGGGAVEVAKVICYYVLPGSMGGSEERGDAYMARAVEKGDDWLMPRWARGKYYYAIKGEDEKARADLQWVATRIRNQFNDPLPWKIHFQENASALLR